MGFTNTSYTDVINSLVKSNINILQNPLYLFNDKKATITDYYNKDVNKRAWRLHSAKPTLSSSTAPYFN